MKGTGDWVTKLFIFVNITNVGPINGLNLQPFQLLEAVVSSSTTSQKHFDCVENKPKPSPPSLTLSPTPLIPKQSIFYFRLALNFLCEKIL